MGRGWLPGKDSVAPHSQAELSDGSGMKAAPQHPLLAPPIAQGCPIWCRWHSSHSPLALFPSHLPCFSRCDFWKPSASLVISISHLMALMRCVVSLALLLSSFKMDLFSFKMWLISLPCSFLKSSKATDLEGGVLGLKSEGKDERGKMGPLSWSHQAMPCSSGASVGRRPEFPGTTYPRWELSCVGIIPSSVCHSAHKGTCSLQKMRIARESSEKTKKYSLRFGNHTLVYLLQGFFFISF